MKRKSRISFGGDNIRCGINSDLGFSDEDRNENIRRIGEIARCSAMPELLRSFRLFLHFVRCAASQESAPAKEIFVEVYVNTDLQTCMERDPKGLYKKQIKNFTGKDSGYEEPLAPGIDCRYEKIYRKGMR